MKKCTVMPLLGIVIALLMTLGCTPTTVVGSGPVMTHGHDSGPFNALDVSDAFIVHVTKSDKCRAHVRINKNLFRYYFMENRGGTLHIGYKNDVFVKQATSEAYIEMPEVREIEFAGAADGELIGDWSMPSLKVDLSGASKFRGNVNVEDLKADLSGASHLSLQGSGKKVDLSGSGGSNFELRDFNGGDVTVDLSDRSHVIITTNGNLSGELSSASSIKYRGKPNVRSLNTSRDSSILRE